MRFPWWYKTPSRVDMAHAATVLAQHEEEFQRASTPRVSIDIGDFGEKGGIPPNLTLDRIINGRTCSPMSLDDFYMYLRYVEKDPENLEFYLWFKHYERRWMKLQPLGEVPSRVALEKPRTGFNDSSVFLSMQMKQNMREEASIDLGDMYKRLDDLEKATAAHVATMIPQFACDGPTCGRRFPGKKTIFSSIVSDFKRAFKSRQESSDETLVGDGKPSGSSSISEESQTISHALQTNKTEIAKELREELDAAIELFLLPNGQREINLPSKLRSTALGGSVTSLDPVHIRPVATYCYHMMKSGSHRNFVRRCVGNGTFETLCVATSLGIVLVIAGFVVESILAFANPVGKTMATSRWYAFIGFPLFFLGMAFILCGARGSCFFLLLFSRRQAQSWERVNDNGSLKEEPAGIKKFIGRMMIFEKKLRVKDECLRSLQKRIVSESLGWGLVFAIIITGLWIFLPIWKAIGSDGFL